MTLKFRHALLATAAGLVFAMSAHAAEVTLKAVSFVPKSLPYSVSFQKGFVDKVNAAGKGEVQVEFVGGPEVVPSAEQGRAIRGGTIDMILGPGGLYLNLVPEADAFLSTNLTPMERRANGAVDLASTIWDKKLNSKILGQAQVGYGFHLYTINEPKIGPDGVPDFKNVKVRVSPAWREFVAAIGGTTIVLPNTEVYTGLERGTVEATGWPISGVKDFGWLKFLKYRIDPEFMKTDLLVLVNNDKFKAVSAKGQKVLQDVATEYEKAVYDEETAATKAEDAEMKAAGIKVVTLSPEGRKKYLSLAFESGWARVKERAPENYEALRAKFFKPLE
jgi:TRAP-type C4-dicarboxylate transport system substrate-binding protein